MFWPKQYEILRVDDSYFRPLAMLAKDGSELTTKQLKDSSYVEVRLKGFKPSTNLGTYYF